MRRLGDIGSDHFPILTIFCADRLEASALPPATLEGEVKEEAKETIREGRREASD